MKKDETSRRKPAMHGATDKGCAGWTPIKDSASDSPSGHPEATNAPLTTPDAVTDSAARAPEPAKAGP